jgi:DNA repair protein RAD5
MLKGFLHNRPVKFEMSIKERPSMAVSIWTTPLNNSLQSPRSRAHALLTVCLPSDPAVSPHATDSAMDICDRPTKKRRFFSDDGLSSSALPSSRPASLTSSTDDQSSSHNSIRHDEPDKGTHDFDEATFRAFVGEEELPEDVVKKVKDAAGGNLERAVNMYFEGSWKSTLAARGAHQVAPSRTIQGWASNLNGPAKSTGTPVSQPNPSPPDALKNTLKKMPHERYIGSFGVAAWTTRSGTNILAAGEPVKIERSRIQPKTKTGRGGKVVQIAGRKSDVVVRFTNIKGEELGRLPEDTAKYVSTLLDQSICRFEGHAIFAPERVRVNDTVYLQLKCYMLKTAFDASGFVKPRDDNRAAGIFEEKETMDERFLRLKQVALVKLFDEINLHPTTTNEAVAKHKKQGLLRAAEMAEQYDQEAANKIPGTPVAGEAEAEDGVELEEDQLDALYQKAQTFDFSTPEAVSDPSYSSRRAALLAPLIFVRGHGLTLHRRVLARTLC